MKTLFLLIPLLTFAQVEIDVVKVYEDVLKMGYESKQIYSVLIEKYEQRNDTIKVECYKIKLKEL
jgi:hypothetical protein